MFVHTIGTYFFCTELISEGENPRTVPMAISMGFFA
jgi:hypothetical protein